jgi:hypothetical protein
MVQGAFNKLVEIRFPGISLHALLETIFAGVRCCARYTAFIEVVGVIYHALPDPPFAG